MFQIIMLFYFVISSTNSSETKIIFTARIKVYKCIIEIYIKVLKYGRMNLCCVDMAKGHHLSDNLKTT